MDWNLIRVFLAVVATGSLSRASTQLGMSQPTVGRYINELEQITGLTLFIRGRSGMELSEAGLPLLQAAQTMAEGAQGFLLKAAGRQEKVAGTLRITASEVVATYLLPAILVAFKQAEPAIEIEIVVSNTVENLLARDADIALRMFRPEQSHLITRKVAVFSLGTYAHKEYLAQFGYPTQPEDLLKHQLVGYDRATDILRGMAAHGLKANRHGFAFRTDNQITYWELVKAGAGVGFGMDKIAQQTADLERLLPELQIEPMTMWLTTHEELRTSLKLRRCVDFLYAALHS